MNGPRACSAGAALLCALAAAVPGAQAAPVPYKVVLLAPADDPRLDRARLEHGFPGHATGPAADALKLAIDEASLPLEAAGAALSLEVVEVADAAAAKAAAAKAEQGGAAALVADLPAPWLLAAADAVKLPVLNVGAADDALRGPDCRAALWHLLPSERMRADALAQSLVARRWRSVLLLVGPDAADAARAQTVRDAVRRYGLKLAGEKPFKLSADPRERELANPRLLTGGDYDVVWVVDGDGEFASTLNFRTVLPRPVVGDGGIVAAAWSPRFDRYGAPQLTRRLLKAAGRPLSAHDWGAWMAGKVLVTAAVAAPKGPAAAFRKALAEGEFDGYKGVAMSFRPWDGQLRQPLLLTDGRAVIDSVPGDGVLHPRNRLDTLGADAPEKLCPARR